MGHADVAPDQLLANPQNWRIHSHLQQQALEGSLDELGWLRPVLVNKTTGHVIDGHLRVKAALERDAATVPVDYVKLTIHEERAALATLDPIVGMAGTDKEQLGTLLSDLQQSASDQLKATLEGLKLPVAFMARVGAVESEDTCPTCGRTRKVRR